MKWLSILFVAILLSVFGCSDSGRQEAPTMDQITIPASGPIQLHPLNPHYFLYEGEAKVLVTSAEHYGALLNLDFDYRKYLETLEADGMNYTRIFTGTYFEIPGESFSIKYNTLAPEKNRVITPWAIVIDDLSGKYRYDLSSWNEAYFDRLKDLMEVAASRGVIVEVTLFSSIYRDEHWAISPQNPANNVNITHDVDRFDAQTLNNGTLLQYQEKFVRKMVQELNAYDNFFFEIQNEPWSDHVVPVLNLINHESLPDDPDWRFNTHLADDKALAWQAKIAAFITEEEASLPKKHLIAQNYCNFKAPIPHVGDNISIMNFHYNWPEVVKMNYGYNKVIGFDESGFAGSGDKVYRKQAWRFILSGGGLFNNLDYSFFCGYEDGSLENDAPGGGSTALRKQLKILSDFIHGFDLVQMKPDYTSVTHAPGLIPYVLSNPGEAYAMFIQSVTDSSELQLNIPSGIYSVKHINTVNGNLLKEEQLEVGEDEVRIAVDMPEREFALAIRRIN